MTSTPSLLVILLVFVAPFALGVFLLTLATKATTKPAKIFTGAIGTISIAFFLTMVAVITPYLWALHLERKWSATQPSTLIEIESHLSFYKKKEIPVSASEWGRNHVLNEGERMIQYMIMWNAPLDIVYDREDKIIAIYTSYE